VASSSCRNAEVGLGCRTRYNKRDPRRRSAHTRDLVGLLHIQLLGWPACRSGWTRKFADASRAGRSRPSL